jgi:ATP-dependent Clp protease ATP-binding subunit ClpA
MVLTGLKAWMHAGPMFERFTAVARHVVVLSQEEARRLNHNYIGTEHVLLGLLGEREGPAFRVLDRFGISLDGVRQEVTDMVGVGQGAPGGHIPFTPRAKKTLELALREALQLHHNYIGTEHILLGLIREGDGVAAQIMRKHADLGAIRMAVLDLVPAGSAEGTRERRWLRRRVAVATKEFAPVSAQQVEHDVLSASPAADAIFSEAARLAGQQLVGSHHLLLAALADPDTAAARALAALGVDLDQAREALRGADVTGTSDEQPEEAGRRQMVIRVSGDRLTIEAADPVIVAAGTAALDALGGEGVIRGDLPAAASLATVWQALLDSLDAIRRAAAPAGSTDGPGKSAETA